ncbi:hypothetical protein [Paenibacillus radicis (ex Gao et al. 2016)]|uniref:Uncharacterized protein n=1 Tax=Paenibacillus radicis (ex Gao et al. 2016) TaxID=1737354 RepID=A0A917MAB1_9BACL|nr:hypothetical protein [Paenibacillus radicis (ex Gao et al. 2016)]GGG87616.1 hypothetical protein GCM10010918_52440 [Paenibacillus radicis (ex Gao et al. 2016)]
MEASVTKPESMNELESVNGASSNSNTTEAASPAAAPSRGWRPILLKVLGLTARILLARHPAALSREAGCFWYREEKKRD